jgi:heme/copper-type cytochrome/quinol oxidase subunit 3|tara:strand:+ start:625 stop:1254 length:630 start_codon:yes stop_codon:yes gene_type:complete
VKNPSSSQTILFSTAEAAVSGRPGITRTPISSGVFGMLIFMVTEAMFFAGLISAYMVIRAGVEEWPPWGQPRLPVVATAFNTVVLLASGFIMAHSRACFKKNELALGRRWLGISILLGTFFLVFQGYEWIQLLKFGFTLSSSVFGGLFYLLIGAHGVHVMGALAVLIYAWYRIKTPGNHITPEGLYPFQLLWYFVVCVWPVLYVLVYLS